MAVVTDSLFLDILFALVPLLYLIYWLVTHNDDYWDKRGVPNIKTGNFTTILLGTQSQAEYFLDLYNKFVGHKVCGTFNVNKPLIVIRDPELINKVLVKDFIHFQDRGNGPQKIDKKDPMQTGLNNLRGKIWRALRYKLTPTFTTGKLRMMFEQVSKSGDNLMGKIEALTEKNNEFETKEFVFEFTLDVIASCAFGLQFKPDSPEFKTFKTTVENLFNMTITSLIRFSIVILSPKLAKLLHIRAFPKKYRDYFLNLTRATTKYRRDNNIHRNDYLQLLLTLKEQEDSGKEIVLTSSDATEDDTVIDQMHYTDRNGQPSDVNMKLMTEEIICANSSVFLLAGSESTASTISFTLLNLAQYPDIQKRLQHEVDSVLKQHGGGWSYDAVREMTYLDQVIQETQRIYPLLPVITRECVLPYKVPDSDLVIEQGTMAIIPVVGLHKDPQYYPEPERFNPDRFEGNNFKPSPYFLPFGDGPRICIAMRFAVMEVKTCLARILSQYTVTLSPKTQLPIKLKKRAVFPTVEGGIWLKFNKRSY